MQEEVHLLNRLLLDSSKVPYRGGAGRCPECVLGTGVGLGQPQDSPNYY